ncbi:MAG: RNA polymerase factor sigma-54 [Fusobacterium sp.]|nr:RNA polymerase factor sigma-54 [Fusobacterium sp.]
MKQFLEIKNEQKLKQNLSLKLSQHMKLSLNILEMSIEKLSDYLQKESRQNNQIEIKFFSSQKNFYRENDFSEIENITDEKNLFNELEEQINFMKLDKKIKENCIFIINNLNSKGYLDIEKRELIKLMQIKENEFEKTFEVIHSLEPYGIGAFSLEDCLKIQLKKKNIFDEKLYKLIDKYLFLIADKKFELIEEKLSLSRDNLEVYIKEIRKLNPIPTRGYNLGKIRKIIPEIIVKKIDGKYTCSINEVVVPKISVKSEEAEKNIYTKVNSLVQAINKRYETLLKISEILVKEQQDFFETEGKNKKLNTLKIIDIAEKLELNASTVSRAIKEKYMQTDFGTISLKKLLCINSLTNFEKDFIEKMIEEEDKEKPYSDQDLTDMLNKDGYNIARRTVSKYRKELGYKNSSKRKI